MSDNLNDEKIWLIGAGYMAREFAKVLINLNLKLLVIGRGESSAEYFKSLIGQEVTLGGVSEWLKTLPTVPEFAIVATPVDQLASNTSALIDYGVKNILVEKPAGLTYKEVKELEEKAGAAKCRLYVGYNRRFYAGVIAGNKMVIEDNGVKSFNFEFTEWSHKIEVLDKPSSVFENWFLTNSTHVIDLAFFMGGRPAKLSSFTHGELSWYKKAAQFSGAGITEAGATFSYSANWAAPGRWGVEVLTKNRRLIYRPLEKLQVQTIGSVKIEEASNIDYSLDEEFKPGIHRQTVAFLNENDSQRSSLVNINEHL
jgi:predicted dehydrogenase